MSMLMMGSLHWVADSDLSSLSETDSGSEISDLTSAASLTEEDDEAPPFVTMSKNNTLELGQPHLFSFLPGGAFTEHGIRNKSRGK